MIFRTTHYTLLQNIDNRCCILNTSGMMPRRFALATSLLICLLPGLCLGATIKTPTVKDARLEISLFASEPDIMTPIGLAIDQRGRLFVLESHTHFPPADYPGPKRDRVKMFQPTNGVGKAEIGRA